MSAPGRGTGVESAGPTLSPARRGYRRLALGPRSVLIEDRAVAVGLVVVAVLLVLAGFGLLIGDYPLDLGRAIRALIGVDPDPLARYFVGQQRAPRIVAAVVVGAALATSGAIFQALSDNPLGSPDVIGFTTGSATGALIAIIGLGSSPAGTALGALAGGFATAAVVYLLAWRGGLTGGRLVLVGIGTAAVLQGVNSLLLVRAELVTAQAAGQWLAGSFNAVGWMSVLLVGAASAVLLPAAALLARPLGALVLGDDLAAGLGVRVEAVRGALVVVGVALVAVATAAAGPIAFIALAAPQIARRLTRTAGVGLGTSALVGAALVLASDLIAQRVFAPTQLAVGVVTGTLGGGYLIWLLARQWRKAAR